MQARKKNMERMAEVVVETDEQVLQHFLSNSNWDERGVLDQVALGADELLGGSKETALLIDESGITKKGKKSVGVRVNGMVVWGRSTIVRSESMRR